MQMFLLAILALLTPVYGEPDEVIIQILYKPKECKDIGEHGDTMHMQYLGRFYDEKREVFDSSYRRDNVPFTYQLGVGGVIEGYQHGTKDMCINERRRLIVPSKYAYGSRGTGNIPGYATLMFDIHLVQINDEPPSYDVPILRTEEITVSGNQECEHVVGVGDVVEIEYIGRLPDGTVFDNSSESGNLKFVVGSHQIIPGIEEGVLSYCPGSVIEMELPPAKAYGDKWDGPVPQWSFVYYNVTIVDHIVWNSIPDGEADLSCENLSTHCSLNYKIQAGDYIELFYKVMDREKMTIGQSTIRYPVGRELFVSGWDEIIINSCVGQHKMCWIPSSLAHKKGTSLFLAPPEKGFWVELKVEKILLTYKNDEDEIDLQSKQVPSNSQIVVDATNEPPAATLLLDPHSGTAHSEL